MFALLSLNKPKGLTSRDAVNRVQRLVKPTKVGHAGTLDPIATGVLVLCLGSATRLIQHIQRMPKQYRGTFLLGRHSDSDDVELEVTTLANPPVPTLEQINRVLPQFTGTIEQVPPAYSAIKIGGTKSYHLARQGKAVELKSRPVEIYRIEVVSYAYPELVLDIRCGGGTYVRSLGRDLAAALGTAAVMSDLVRTAIGQFNIETAIDPRSLTPESLAAAALPPALAVADLPRVELTLSEVEELRNGRPIARREANGPGEQAAFDPAGNLFALMQPKRDGQLWPTRVFGEVAGREPKK